MNSKQNYWPAAGRLGLLMAFLVITFTGAISLHAINSTVLIVYGGGGQPNSSENAMKSRLQAYGATVNFVLDNAAIPNDATNKNLILVSSSVGSGAITKYRGIPVPLINWEHLAYDGLGMADADGAQPSASSISIVDAAHPLAAGLPAGAVTIYTANQNFAVGTPVASAAIVATGPSSAAALFALEAGAALSTVTAPGETAQARRVGIFLGNDTFNQLNANGLKLFDAAVKWALNVSDLGTLPGLVITQPLDLATFPANGNIALAVSVTNGSGGAVTNVGYFFNGTNSIGNSSSSPFGFTWTNVPTGRYDITARLTDNNGVSFSSPSVHIVVGTPPPEILFVVGNIAGSAGENAIKGHLQGFGLAIRMIADTALIPSYVTNEAAILVSSTVTSGNIDKYRDIPVPIVNWEVLAFDGLGMADANGFTIPGQTTIEITNSSHGLAAGLPLGVVTILNSAVDIGAAIPVASATVVGISTEGNSIPVLFGLESGAALSEVTAPGLTAPARRVGIFLTDNNFTQFTVTGVRLFDAALAWAMNTTFDNPPTVSLTQPTNGQHFAVGANIALSATAADDSGTVTKVEFFAEGIKIGEDLTSPFQFTWTNVAQGFYGLVAKATDGAGLTNISTLVPISVGTPPPVVLLVIVTSGDINANAGDRGMSNRLAMLGFNVVVKADTSTTSLDAVNKALIIISGTVISGNVGTKFTSTTVPILNFEGQLEDELQLTISNGDIYSTTQSNILIVANHPLSAGLSLGTHTVMRSLQTYSWGFPGGEATVVAQIDDGSGTPCIYGYDTGALLVDGVTPAPGRRVHFFSQNNGFANFNPTGMMLFDAAVSWAMNTTLVKPVPVFNPPVLQGANITISWTGIGFLQQADSITGPWTDVDDLANPITFLATDPMRFFRARQ